MPSPVWILGLLILVIAVSAARQRFYAEHRRTYSSPAGFPTSRVNRPALLRRDPDPVVERARRRYLVVLAAAIVLTLWGITELPRV